MREDNTYIPSIDVGKCVVLPLQTIIDRDPCMMECHTSLLPAALSYMGFVYVIRVT